VADVLSEVYALSRFGTENFLDLRTTLGKAAHVESTFRIERDDDDLEIVRNALSTMIRDCASLQFRPLVRQQSRSKPLTKLSDRKRTNGPESKIERKHESSEPVGHEKCTKGKNAARHEEKRKGAPNCRILFESKVKCAWSSGEPLTPSVTPRNFAEVFAAEQVVDNVEDALSKVRQSMEKGTWSKFCSIHKQALGSFAMHLEEPSPACSPEREMAWDGKDDSSTDFTSGGDCEDLPQPLEEQDFAGAPAEEGKSEIGSVPPKRGRVDAQQFQTKPRRHANEPIVRWALPEHRRLAEQRLKRMRLAGQSPSSIASSKLGKLDKHVSKAKATSVPHFTLHHVPVGRTEVCVGDYLAIRSAVPFFPLWIGEVTSTIGARPVAHYLYEYAPLRYDPLKPGTKFKKAWKEFPANKDVFLERPKSKNHVAIVDSFSYEDVICKVRLETSRALDAASLEHIRRCVQV
jgi:hypothetical protein